MQKELFIAITAGLGAMFGWGFADFFAKKTIDKAGPLVSLVWAHIFGTISLSLVVAYLLLTSKKFQIFPITNEAWFGLIFYGALQAAVYLLVYIGFGKGKLAILNPIFASYAGVAAFFSITFLGENANSSRILSLILVFAGIIFLSIDLKGLRLKKLNMVPGLKEIGLASILAAFWTLGWDKFIGSQNFVSYALLMYTFMTITAFIIAKAQKVNLNKVDKSVWKFLILIGVTEIIAYLSISYGFSKTTLTSVVALVSGSFSLVTIILAHMFLKERFTKIQALGALALVFGIIFLSIKK